MQTPIIQTNTNANHINGNNDAANANSKNKITPEFSFDKILSREISGGAANRTPMNSLVNNPPKAANNNNNANRSNANNAANNTEAKAMEANRNRQTKQAEGNANNANNAAEAANNAEAGNGIAKGEPSPNSANGTSGETKPTTTAQEHSDATDDSSGDAQTLLGAAMPADMLALVASLNQNISKVQDIPQTDATEAALTPAAGKVDAELANLSQLEASVAATDDKSTASNGIEAEGTDPQQAFAASLSQAETGKKLPGAGKETVKADAAIASQGKESSDIGKQLEVEKAPVLKADAGSGSNKPSADALPKMSDILAAQAGNVNKAATGPKLASAEAVITPTISAPVAQANNAFAQIASVKAGERIAPAVGSDGWDQAVGQKVIWMAAGGQQSAELTLNPPDMGPMKVVLSVSNDQTSISFSAAQPEVRQALEAAMPKLREMMSEAGVNLGTSTVSTNLPNQQQQAQSDQARHGAQHGAQSGLGRDEGSTVEIAPSVVRSSRIGEGLGMVDTFV